MTSQIETSQPSLPPPSDTLPLLLNGLESTDKNYSSVAYPASFSDAVSSSSTASSASSLHKTTVWQTFIHLLKGYIGPGCLSLPWAVSQLGVTGGIVAIFVMAFWSSYNCWTVVQLKRFIEAEQQQQVTARGGGGGGDDKWSETSSNITYPDVGEWAHGTRFQSYITACICTQQLAICTVFLSFVGENLLAVLEWISPSSPLATHLSVMTLALPLVMSLMLLPSLKTLAPVMAAGTVLLMIAFAVLGIVIEEEWSHRPSSPPTMNLPQVPLALCAILYSYEGICLILPIESAMQDTKHFSKIFLLTMVLVAIILSVVSSLCVLAFGNVTNGSVTAFLLQEYRDDTSITWWLMLANTTVSLSVILTYPIQMFPALELIGPWISRKILLFRGLEALDESEEDMDKDLSGFEPLPPLPEHDIASLDSLPETEHQYSIIDGIEDGDEEDVDVSQSSVKSILGSVATVLPKMTMPGDSLQLRALLVLLTYLVAVVVPNVQALISLAGALAGSSTALLIPPILELAWIKHMESDEIPEDAAAVDTEAYCWNIAPIHSRFGKWWYEKLKCYFLLLLGFIFFAIGTYASLADIIKIYRGAS